MRRADREVKEERGLREILEGCSVCRLAMVDEAGPYIVPMNFGYKYADGRLTLYFHSAKAGRKISILSRPGARAAFELDCGHELIPGETACTYGYHYKSITGCGTVRFLEEIEKKKYGLKVLMRHQAREEFEFTDEAAGSVVVFVVEVESFMGKMH